MSKSVVEEQLPRSALFRQAGGRGGKGKTVTFQDRADRGGLPSPKLPGWSRYLASMAEARHNRVPCDGGPPSRSRTTLMLEDCKSGDPRLEKFRIDLKPFMHGSPTPPPPRLPLRKDQRPPGPNLQQARTTLSTPRKLNVFLPSIEQQEPQKTLASAKARSGRSKRQARGGPPTPAPPPPQHQRLENEYYRARTLLHRRDYYEDRDIPSDPRKYPMFHGKRIQDAPGPIDHFRTYLETLRKDGRIRNKSIGTRVLLELENKQAKAVDRIPKVHYVKMLGLEKLLQLEIKPPLLKLSIMNRARMPNQDHK